MKRVSFAALALVSSLMASPALAAPGAPADSALVSLRPAPAVRDSLRVQYLAVARAGERIVAVGERGVIALSDDGGRSFRQARVVPAQASLTAVQFIDAKTGFAVGHWGVILRSDDGGETWVLQRSEASQDRPLFSVHFRDSRHGWAVGLWSLMLATDDGGKTWSAVTLPAAGEGGGDRNLYSIFSDPAGAIYVTSEQGAVLRSMDGGVNWSLARTGYTGSLWSGVALRSGEILVGGLRGSILRSTDQGRTWSAAPVAASQSVTSMIQLRDGSVAASALDGTELRSSDGGQSFKASQQAERSALTAVIETDAGLLWLSNRGVVSARSR